MNAQAESEIKYGYTVTIVLVNGHKIELDGFFSDIEEAKEAWELTKKQLEETGFIQVSSKYIYYLNPQTISYVRVGLSTSGGPSDEEVREILKEGGY